MNKEFSKERVIAGRQYEKEREYWLHKLSGELVKSSFPPDQGKAFGSKEFTRKTIDFELPADLCERLLTIGNNSDSRLHMLLVTGLSLLLYKYTDRRDILIGTPIDKQDVEGEFINTVLALRTIIDEQMTVKELLMQVKQAIIEAGENQNYPLESIPYELGIPVAEGEFPLFGIAVLLRNIQEKSYIDHLPLDMVFSFLRTGEQASTAGEVEYNASLYEEETIRRIINHFTFLMQEAFFQVDIKAADVPLMDEQERNKIIVDFNNTGADYPEQKMIHQLFEEQAAKTPGSLAVESPGKQLTYRQLNEKANRLARLLRKKGIAKDTVAGIMLESSVEVPIAIMAVLKAGAAYLPMGFEYPEERINYLLENSRAQILLTKQSLLNEMEIKCPVMYVEDEELYSGAGENLEPVDDSRSLAYIIYTSGTTGQPKGVMIEHRSLVNYIYWAARTYVKDEQADFPLYTSISFDLTVTSIFTPLITGSAVIVYGGIDKQFYIEKVIDDNRVAVVKLTPSHLRMIKQKHINNSRIKRLIVGGEELETQLARDIYDNFGKKIEIYNEYGPTETVVGSMIYKFDPGAGKIHSVPIGVPIANTRVYLLNRLHQPVPAGVEAELYIAGDGVARGYVHNSPLTEEKFVVDPFVPGTRMYRTGDLAVRLADGTIEYRGRIDHQVKIRGYRVETGEIEAKIVDFQQRANRQREQKENIVEQLNLKSIQRCKKCLIPVNYPGGIHFDEEGVCDICREFENYEDKAWAYFKTMADFDKVVEKARRTKRGDYDCLMLYSGGKDSSYVLHRLVEMGLKVLSFTFDNGYISETAFENIARTTALLDVDHIVLDSEAMKEIFVESLWSDYNVCNGCFKAVNTFGTMLAHKHDINLVVSGLTRGQIFDIKLHGLFKLGVFDEETIEERLQLFRKNYHSMSHRTSRLIGVEISDEMLENTHFADYFRYDNASTADIFAYLEQKDKDWLRPADTGASSSNCIINDVGIYVHLKDKGCHFYGPQLSWDCRFGTITREEGIEEITGFKVDYPKTRQVLKEIGYYDAFTGAVVVDVEDNKGEKALCAYMLADKDLNTAELKEYLSQELPDYMVPTYYTRIDKIPLTASGKVDRRALPEPELDIAGEYTAPRDKIEKNLAAVWSELLGIKEENIGIDINFFEAGGHSLRATFLAASIQKEFDVNVPLVKIFERPTIRGLAEYIKESTTEVFVAIPVVEKKEYYSLSTGQERLYLQHRVEPDSTAYNMPAAFLLRGKLDRERFSAAFRKILNRHDILRTTFFLLDDRGVQRVHNQVDFAAGFSRCSRQEARDRVIEFVKPFDLEQAPLLRVELLQTGEDNYVIFFDMHHIISDGTSMGLIVEEFAGLYEGKEPVLLPVQYKDYAAWQVERLNEEQMKKQEEYWLKQLDGYLFTQLPVDRFDSFKQAAGKEQQIEIDASLYKEIDAFCIEHDVTKFIFMITLFGLALAREIDQPDITVGIPTAAREHVDLKYVIGMFLNVLLIRLKAEDEESYLNFLLRGKNTVLSAFENQDYPYDMLGYKIRQDNRLKKNEPISILFNYFPVEIDKKMTVRDFEIEPYKNREISPKYDITVYAHDAEDRLTLTFVYKSNLYYDDSIDSLMTGYLDMIRFVLANHDTTIAGLMSQGEEASSGAAEFEKYYDIE